MLSLLILFTSIGLFAGFILGSLNETHMRKKNSIPATKADCFKMAAAIRELRAAQESLLAALLRQP